MLRLARTLVAVLAAALLASCVFVEGDGESGVPYRTVMDTIADTVFARTSGDVDAEHLLAFSLEWSSATGAGDTAATLGDVSGMAVGPDGRVFVWDHVTPALWLFDAQGKLVRKIGGKGAGPGEYDQVNGITVRPDGRLVAWDAGNARLNVYDADGNSVTSWKLPFGGHYTDNAITADTSGRIWMRWGLRQPGVDGVSTPAALRFDTVGVLVDTAVSRAYTTDDAPLVARRQDGPNSRSVTSRAVPYATASTFAVSPFGYFVSGPSRPYVVHAQLNGKPLTIERAFTPVSVSDAERAQRRANVEFYMRRTQEDWRWDGADIPSNKPAYAALNVGLDGRMWVQLYTPSEAFEPDAPPSTQANPAPPVKFRATDRQWDVYEPDGRYLGRVAGTRRFTPYVMRGNAVWGVLRDDDDVPAIVKMRAGF